MWSPKFPGQRGGGNQAPPAGECGTDGTRGPVTVALDQPAGLGAGPGGGEGLDPEELLLEGTDEPLGTAVAFRLPHEGRASVDAQEAQLALVGVAQELAATIVAQTEAGGDHISIRPK